MAEFTSVRRVTARKQHRCDDCGQMIQPGEQYDRVAGMNYEYGFGSYKTHHHGGVCRWRFDHEPEPVA